MTTVEYKCNKDKTTQKEYEKSLGNCKGLCALAEGI